MAQTDYFLKIPGIDGESTDRDHRGENDVLAWSWGISQSGTVMGAGLGAGKAQFQSLSFTMRYSKASPELMLACATGKHLPEATLFCRKAGGEQHEYLIVELENVMVSSYQTGGSSGDVIPVDQVVLDFERIKFEYKSQDEKGNVGRPVSVGYDITANTKL